MSSVTHRPSTIPGYITQVQALLKGNSSEIHIIRFKRGQKGSLKKGQPDYFTGAFLSECARKKKIWVLVDHIRKAQSISWKFKGIKPGFSIVRSKKALYPKMYRRGHTLMDRKKYPMETVVPIDDEQDIEKIYSDQFQTNDPRVSKDHFLHSSEIAGWYVVILDNPLKNNPWELVVSLEEIMKFQEFVMGMVQDFRPDRYSGKLLLRPVMKCLKLMESSVKNGNLKDNREEASKLGVLWQLFNKDVNQRILDIQTQNISREDSYDKIPRSIISAMRTFCYPSGQCQVVSNGLEMEGCYMTDPYLTDEPVVVTWFDGVFENKQVDIEMLKQRTGVKTVRIFELKRNRNGNWLMVET